MLQARPPGSVPVLCALFVMAVGVRVCGAVAAVDFPEGAGDDAILEYLTARVEKSPEHSDSWRLLGRVHNKQGDSERAEECFRKALDLGPENAAAHFDLGRFLQKTGDEDGATLHFTRVLEIAPESDYASELRDSGVSPGWASRVGSAETLPVISAAEFASLVPAFSPDSDLFAPVDYRTETFDSSDELENQLDRLADPVAPRPVHGSLEFGAVYNTNVTLTPISRSLRNIDAASAQLLVIPSVEWTAREFATGRAGALFRGNFTLNEHHLDQFNLASFQPGAFFEQDAAFTELDSTCRLEYVWGLDLLGGSSLGDRHSITGSILTVQPNARIDWIYATIAYSQFDDDGLNPAIDSLDGTTWTVGMARFFLTGNSQIPTWSVGTDLEFADTFGDDARYQSIRVYTDATFSLPRGFSLIPTAAIGFRNYPDFTGSPARDELTGRLGGKLKYQLSETTSVSVVCNYDRFHSDNERFDVDRTIAGITATFMY